MGKKSSAPHSMLHVGRQELAMLPKLGQECLLHAMGSAFGKPSHGAAAASHKQMSLCSPGILLRRLKVS